MLKEGITTIGRIILIDFLDYKNEMISIYWSSNHELNRLDLLINLFKICLYLNTFAFIVYCIIY